jgi:hypothetical protein
MGDQPFITPFSSHAKRETELTNIPPRSEIPIRYLKLLEPYDHTTIWFILIYKSILITHGGWGEGDGKYRREV